MKDKEFTKSIKSIYDHTPLTDEKERAFLKRLIMKVIELPQDEMNDEVEDIKALQFSLYEAARCWAEWNGKSF